MNLPEVKVVAISNVYSRLMFFKNKGDVETGHLHTYDHATLLSSGSVLYEVLDDYDGKTISSKVFKAPEFIFVDKNKYHRLTSLEDKTVCVCIHALRTIDEEILSPDFFIEPLHRTRFNEIFDFIEQKTGKESDEIVNLSERIQNSV